jgi:hypothetical protein
MNRPAARFLQQLTGKDAKAAHRTGAASPPRVGLESRRRVALATRIAPAAECARRQASGGLEW